MNRGYVKLYRKFFDDGLIQNHKLCVFMIWSLLKATHKPFKAILGRQIIPMKPGQFIFGRRQASRELGLSEQETRTVIGIAQKAEFITIKSTNKFSIITIINWNIYQNIENENNQQMTNKQPTDDHIQTHKNIRKKHPAEVSSQISVLQERYSDQETIDQAFKAVQSTRRLNRLADGVRLSILQAWQQYPVDSVIQGIRTYLGKDYARQGKGEKYLLGIIRNNKGTGTIDAPEGKAMPSTGSPLLDEYYRKQRDAIQ